MKRKRYVPKKHQRPTKSDQDALRFLTSDQRDKIAPLLRSARFRDFEQQLDAIDEILRVYRGSLTRRKNEEPLGHRRRQLKRMRRAAELLRLMLAGASSAKKSLSADAKRSFCIVVARSLALKGSVIEKEEGARQVLQETLSALEEAAGESIKRSYASKGATERRTLIFNLIRNLKVAKPKMEDGEVRKLVLETLRIADVTKDKFDRKKNTALVRDVINNYDLELDLSVPTKDSVARDESDESWHARN